ncbi:MAG: flagellar motor protein MotB [Verrucomicrobiales bacterium]|nr:flagellar motor protein MotB [Verrucomicrobiales bacterium]MDB6131170.1 flagellar motor protein MotB [Verrucomicrobiales bacterium]
MAKKRHPHHGGAWKVAYADFVTAMMALFLVLWLTSQDEKIKEAVERAFKNPFSSVTKESVGIIPNKDSQALRSTGGNFDSASAIELTMLRRLNDDLLKSLKTETDSEEKDQRSVQLDLSPEGLRISIFDRSKKPIFERQSSSFTSYGAWVFSTLAWEISRHANFVVELEGHTEQGNAQIREDYGNWEISSDRANAARRKLEENGVKGAQIRKVAGFGDTSPMPGAEPADQINRRVTVLLKVKAGGKNS